MGNDISTYSEIIEERDLESENKEVIYGSEPYGKMFRLVSRCKSKHWFDIYNIKNGTSTWRIHMKIKGKEIEMTLDSYIKDKILFNIPLKYNHSISNSYTTVLKGQHGFDEITLELYADNIHCQKIQNLEKNVKVRDTTVSSGIKIITVSLFGYLKVGSRDKIPIVF
ncbi:Hypothetical protein HVR_LOCUS1053 [uncultured virus]|nr:Hypothetical protein HVR_LOCUS1053 [uncultured virus]